MKRFDGLSLKKVLMGFLCFFFLFAGVASAGVTVYAEGAYTTGDTGDLAVYIYADITAPNLCSFGVKLNYDTTKLISPVADKNESIWYMGTTSDKKAYMDPDTSTAGEIIFIGGKLDTSTPLAGVAGTRVLLGKVIFSRAAATRTDNPGSNPESYFGIVLNYGHGNGTGDFKNFVAADGTVMDNNDVTFGSITVRERGDANGDKVITNLDMFAIRNIISAGGSYNVYADCNSDEVITNLDMFCVRGKL
jgi:hypothetical protein